MTPPISIADSMCRTGFGFFKWSFALVLATAIAVGSLSAPSSSWAQKREGGPDRVRRALEITEHRIERAEQTRSDAPREARREIDAARRLQRHALEALADRDPERAMRLTHDARRHADRAIAATQGLPNPDRVVRQLEHTRELLARARERMSGCKVPRARELLARAFDKQGRADDAARAGRHLAALRLTVDAREDGGDALRACGLDEGPRRGPGPRGRPRRPPRSGA